MKIPWEQFRWYAAFHDEGHHPHVHMICYSADGKSGFLDKADIEKIKSGIAKEIFRHELTELYRQQTMRRDELVEKSGEVMGELIAQMQTGTLDDPRIEQLMEELSRKLKNTGGKKQYGYLKAPVKAIVDEIVDELANEPHVSAAYELWYLLREEVLRTYKDDLPERLPLSQQKEFKRVKNLVIEEAIRLGEYSEVFAAGDDSQPEAENNGELHSERTDNEKKYNYAQYRAAKQILADPSSTQQQTAKALEWLTNLADAGLDCAQYALGKLYLLGRYIPQDKDAAARWFSMAADQGNEYAQYFLDRLNSSPALLTNATRLLRHMGNIFRDQSPPPAGGICFVDSKLRRKMQEKKVAMGHKRDDHEEQVQHQQRL